MIKITVDTCIFIDLFKQNRQHHRNALKLFNLSGVELYCTETTLLKELQDLNQKSKLEELINVGKVKVLPEPQMGTPVPASIPMDMSHISPIRDLFIKRMTKSRGIGKHKIIRDYLIAEAHHRNKNDYLLTRDLDDYKGNEDISICDYAQLFDKLL